jgi:5-oxoprolinase (ATP-hydrolysing)
MIYYKQGRLLSEHFPSIFGPNENLPLNYEITMSKFTSLTQEINAEIEGKLTPEEVALGFLNIANEVSKISHNMNIPEHD